MKTILTIAIFFCLAAPSFAQRVQSSCDSSESYNETAAKIEYEYMFAKDSTYGDSIQLPQTLRKRIIHALNAVNNSDLEKAKEVTGRINFESDPIDEFNGGAIVVTEDYYSFRRIQVNIDTTVLWQKNLHFLKIPTGDAQIDNFLKIYHLTVDTSNIDHASFPYSNIVLWLQNGQSGEYFADFKSME